MIKERFSSLTNPAAGAAAAGLRRARAARHALRDRHRQGDHRDGRRDQQPASGAQPGLGRRLSRHHGRPAVRRRCSAPGSTSSASARTRRSSRAAADRRLFPMPRTKDEAVDAGARRRTTASPRGLEALRHRDSARRAVRLHRDGARPRQAGDDGSATSGSSTESPDRESASRADEYTRNFLQDEALPTIWQELAFHRRFVPAITLAEINALAERLVPRSEPAGRSCRRRRRPASCCPTEPQLAAAVKTACGEEARSRTSTRPPGETLMDAPPAARHDRQDDRRAPRPASPSGRSRTARPSCSSRRSSRRIRSCSAPTAPGGTSLASDADFIPARVADDVVPAGGVGKFSGVDARPDARRQGGRRPAVHRRDRARGWAAAARRRISRRCSSCIYLRFTQPRADPTAFAALASQARGLLANQMASPDVVFNQTIDAALSRQQPAPPARDAGDGGPVEPGEVAGVLQGALRRREQLHVRLRRQLHAGDDQAAGRDLHRQPAGDARARRPGATSASRRRRAWSRRRSRRASRRRARWRSSSPGRSPTTSSTCWRCGR